MEDFKKALEGTLGRKHIDNIVDQVASFPDRFDALYTLCLLYTSDAADEL